MVFLDLKTARVLRVEPISTNCCESKESSWWASTMREYNNRDAKVNDMELDPCMAAEVRLKKKRMGTRSRKILVLLLAAFVLLCLSALFLILLSNRTQSSSKSVARPSHTLADNQLLDLRPASAVLEPSPETQYFRRANDHAKVVTTTEEPEEETELEEEDPTVSATEAPIDEDEEFDDDEEEEEEEEEEVVTTTQKPPGIDWSRLLPELDDDNAVNLADPEDVMQEMPYVDSEVIRSSCFDYFKDDYLESGVYKMQNPNGESFFAACDMDTGSKGWTIMSRRIDNLSFWNRTFDEYADGFGNPGQSYWLGLDRVHELISQFPGGKALLRIELRNDLCNRHRACSGEGEDGYWWGEWKFAIDDRSKLFKLSVSAVLNGNLSTTAFDYFHSMNNNQPFTTVDRDNDRRVSKNCAVFRNFGGWWHRDCGFMALNGKYGITEGHSKGLYWLFQRKTNSPTTVTYNINPGVVVMMLRPL
ncbi:hypothetical protein QR680_019055 [Steinernema hermaphroditum]|uniref:Fibrinogen C-terminal domain-containing protein n=1 Tax=Steinernema hermaphroditum TaxID=289476 RepID=A0AA39LR96_9BILA|nr:hypothetical protein QR680_019055 [Steinernema hermaphroditum]